MTDSKQEKLCCILVVDEESLSENKSEDKGKVEVTVEANNVHNIL